MLYLKLKLELPQGKENGRTWGRKLLPRRYMENQKPLATSKHLWVNILCLAKVMIILIVISYLLKLNRSFELGSDTHIK